MNLLSNGIILLYITNYDKGSEASHETDKKSSKKEKGILGGSKKKDKEKKKEKEARYATLGKIPKYGSKG